MGVKFFSLDGGDSFQDFQGSSWAPKAGGPLLENNCGPLLTSVEELNAAFQGGHPGLDDQVENTIAQVPSHLLMAGRIIELKGVGHLVDPCRLHRPPDPGRERIGWGVSQDPGATG